MPIMFPEGIVPTPCTRRTFRVQLPGFPHGAISLTKQFNRTDTKIQRYLPTGELKTAWSDAPENNRFVDVEE